MNRMIKACLRYPSLTVIVSALAVVVGLWALVKMPRTEDPTITIRTGIVAAAYPGATSEQMEKQVTRVLEQHIFKYQEVRKAKTYSTSRPGVCIINVELEKNVKNTDGFWAKLRHEMILTKVTELPPQVMGPVVDSDFGDTVAMLIAVSSEHCGYRELKDYVDKIKDVMRTVPSVGKIAVYGNQTEQIWITSSPERMSQYFTDPRQIMGALAQRNAVQGAGSVRTATERIPFHNASLFQTEDEIRRLVVGMSPSGQPSYIGDFAQVQRRYQDPEFLVRYDGRPALMISVEMQKGKNIVEMGAEVDQAMARLRPLLPPDLRLDYIANQPKVVQERMAGLGHEFVIAIVCVILVTVILLPMRVAVIAALAIPASMLTTLGVMDFMGLALHQVSIAALILVLGIVVDNAIVIVDNYMELMDHQVPREEAAWRSATEVVTPVLVATLTIIAAFLPLLIISGASGEFIMALPITVAVALTVSFLVAVYLTPLLCRTFILKGLHDPTGKPGDQKPKRSALDLLQAGYNKAIVTFMARPALAVVLGIGAVVGGVLLFRVVAEQFFPTAERNQFVIDVWMSQGSRFEATDAVMRRIEGELRQDRQVTHYASFVGQSSPRFYYNVNPQQPDPAYGQFIVNTTDLNVTPGLVKSLRTRLARLAPEATVLVQELQQGDVQEAPLEYRIVGDDPDQLKAIGEQVGDILRADPGTRFIHTDYRNDSPMLAFSLNTELASRLGLTHADASSFLQGAFDGTTVSTFWEGDRAVDVVLRADPGHRDSFDAARDTYLSASLSGNKAPLRMVTDLVPVWQISRIVRRNGVPTLTVRCLTADGVYASAVLDRTLPKVRALPLPPGYRIDLGGEWANREETFPEMIGALGISLVAIYLILMLQFHNLTEPLVVMLSIALSLFGMAFGLLVTHNPFGFTAFMGMIALCGIAVRNAIILIDYIKERLRHGVSLEDAATQAGERRLRPIFLTTMAAAVGVTPMILSGSKLWSPLASVMAVGLVFSMFFTLLVVPVIYVLVCRNKVARLGGHPVVASLGLLMVLCAGASIRSAAAAPERSRLTLEQAVASAVENSHGVRLARAKVQEIQAKRDTAYADFMPQLSTDGQMGRIDTTEAVKVTAGALGTIPGQGPFPAHDINLDQGKRNLWVQNLTLAQPLTQLVKIHHAYEAASAEERAAQAELRRVQTDIAFKTRQVYLGLLIAQARRDAAQAGIAAARATDLDAREAVRDGESLDVVQIASRALLLQNRQRQLAEDQAVRDLEAELNDLMGQPIDTPLEPAPILVEPRALPAREALLGEALRNNPELARAAATLEQGRSGLRAAKADYIPEVGVFMTQTHQEGLPFVTSNFNVVGVKMSWSILDGHRKASVVHQRNALVAEATEDRDRLSRRVELDLDKTLRKLETSQLLVETAEAANDLNAEKARIAANAFKNGLSSAARRADADAAAKAAEADLLAARLNLELDFAELDRQLGRL
jgi:multidrug efflux pump subunit AcrB/outer membrane protein TolC